MTYAVGQMIGGRYEVQRVLKPGGQGEVYEVLDTFQKVVGVMKLIDTTLLPGGIWDEAQVLQQLADDHILKILNADVTGGQPYIVTALAEHGTLKDRLDAAGGLGLPVDRVVDWLRQASIGVARAHDAMLVHNDLKPENLFLSAKGECLVGDFGLASLVPKPPLMGVARGATPTTAAPEVAAGWPPNGPPPASFQTDVYSLGATGYWLLAGRPPVDVDNIPAFAAKMAAAAAQIPPRLRDVAPHVPASVAAVIEKAISHDPADRYATVNELDAALGSRSIPRRKWERTNQHPGHLGCWRGEESGKSTYVLCLRNGSTSTMCRVTTVHESSGHRVPGGARYDKLKNAPLAVRRVIDKLS
jgi:eukaryotic-like serine/threonine-protein kinase